MNTKQLIESLRAVDPAAAATLESSLRDGMKVKTRIEYKLEKFDGEYTPGAQPIETITGQG